MITGITVIALLVVGLDAFVYLSLRDTLEESLQEVLVARLQLGRELSQELEPTELDDRLTALGVPAEVDLPGGGEVRSDPRSTRFQVGPPAQPETLPPPLASLEGELPDGGSITVFASRAGVQSTLDTVLVLEMIGSVVAIALSVAVLWRVSRVVLRPVDEVVRVARSIAAGREGERLDPDRTDTELGRMAAAFDEMLDALEAAVDEARASEQRAQRFLADAAHQLRTPIAGIRASVETLLRTPEPDERDRLLDNLARETARTSRLVGSLLRMAQLDRGTGPYAEPTPVVELVREEAERVADLAPTLGVEVHEEVGRGDLEVHLEIAGIREALANLLDNARRHAASRIDITVRRRDEGVDIAVADDGPGLADEEAEQAFERFVSLDGQGGSGLGLPISRAVARNHGGELAWRDDAFVLSLPLRPPGDLPAPDSQ